LRRPSLGPLIRTFSAVHCPSPEKPLHSSFPALGSVKNTSVVLVAPCADRVLSESPFHGPRLKPPGPIWLRFWIFPFSWRARHWSEIPQIFWPFGRFRLVPLPFSFSANEVSGGCFRLGFLTQSPSLALFAGALFQKRGPCCTSAHFCAAIGGGFPPLDLLTSFSSSRRGQFYPSRHILSVLFSTESLLSVSASGRRS